MVLEPILCPTCQGVEVCKHGSTAEGKARYRCLNSGCERNTFILNYSYRGRIPEVKHQIVEMAINGSGIRDTARVLKIGLSTVIAELKKSTRTKIYQ
jgi:insertion element IS1 protein InsB